MLTRLSGNITKLRTQRRFKKLSRWITKTCHRKYSFAFSAH